MNWDDMKMVDAAANMRSLSGAAKALDLSQPQLSRRLKAFENRIGARLFDRTPSGLKPTEAGLKLIPLAAEMRHKADAAIRVLPDLAANSLRVVRIAVDEVRARILTDAFPVMLEHLNGLELELISSQKHVDHQSRSIELQIRSCMPETDTLVARKVGEVAYAVYGSTSYVKEFPAAHTLERYKECSWIGFTPDGSWYPAQSRWLESRLSMRPRFRTNTMTTLMNIIASGAGLGLLPVFMGDQNRELVRLDPPEPDLLCTEHIIVHRDLCREPAVRTAIEAIALAYKSLAPRLKGSDHANLVAAE